MKIVLGHELKRQRCDVGLTQQDASEILGCTQQKIDYLESGGGVKPLELNALLDRYGASETERSYALDLHSESNKRSRRGAFRLRFQRHMRLLVDMEPTCQRYRCYRTMVVPGILQTEDYMRTLFRAWRPSPTQEQIDRDTSDRLARQSVLDNEDQQFWFILDEAALRRVAGNSAVAEAQIAKLIEILDRPNVELQVVPFSTGYYMGQSHDYTIFGYDTQPPVDIVYLEQHEDGEYIDDVKRTARYLTLWEQQKAAAMGPEETRRFLLRLATSS